MQPTLRSALLFAVKARGLRVKRRLQELGRTRASAGVLGDALANAPVAGASVTPLWTHRTQAEFRLTAGKVENLRVAARRLNGREFAAGEVFSFWRALGRPTRGKGYRHGREIREGCVVPSIAGGLCQLSNGLYDAALKGGFEIVERHAHTRIVAGSLAADGRDATVFWNYVDLRFTLDRPFRIEVDLSDTDLRVQLRTQADPAVATEPVPPRAATLSPPAASCETCGVMTCFRHIPTDSAEATTSGVTAFLVDAFWPEHDRWIQARRAALPSGSKSLLVKPLRNILGRFPQYAWRDAGFDTVKTTPLATLRRSRAMRGLTEQGADRQRAKLAWDERLARAMLTVLPPEATHLVVTQDLATPLSRLGALGGRTFDLLVQRAPTALLQAELDRAAALHPESPTLADFRIPAAAVDAEDHVLRSATRLVTPSPYLARYLGPRALTLPWVLPHPVVVKRPAVPLQSRRPTALVAGSVAGRRGVYEIRDAARILGLTILVRRRSLEGDAFWRGVEVERLNPDVSDSAAVLRADVVLAPSFVESAPRLALLALSLGRPVVASHQTGLGDGPGRILIEAGDGDALVRAVADLLGLSLDATNERARYPR